MAFISDTAFDTGLAWIVTNGTRLDLCSQEPTTYAGATTTYTLGRKTSLTIGSPAAGAVSGRRVVVPAVTDGTNAANGTATHWAITDGSSVLVATGALSANKTMVSGDPWTSTSFSITFPDAAAE